MCAPLTPSLRLASGGPPLALQARVVLTQLREELKKRYLVPSMRLYCELVWCERAFYTPLRMSSSRKRGREDAASAAAGALGCDM